MDPNTTGICSSMTVSDQVLSSVVMFLTIQLAIVFADYSAIRLVKASLTLERRGDELIAWLEIRNNDLHGLLSQFDETILSRT